MNQIVSSDDLEEKTIQTYDQTAEHWAKDHAVINEWDWALETLQKYLPKGSIFEIGCGGGRDAKKFLELGYDYFGTDASLGMVRVAQAKNPGGKFEQRSIYDLAKIDRKFDGFWAAAVLLHIPKLRIDEAINSLKTVLKDGAIGIITIKAGDHEEFEVRDKDGRHEERLFVYWKKAEFETVLKQHHFKILEYHYQPVSERTKWHVFFVQKLAQEKKI